MTCPKNSDNNSEHCKTHPNNAIIIVGIERLALIIVIVGVVRLALIQ